jgi:hypothetical protein
VTSGFLIPYNPTVNVVALGDGRPQGKYKYINTTLTGTYGLECKKAPKKSASVVRYKATSAGGQSANFSFLIFNFFSPRS